MDIKKEKFGKIIENMRMSDRNVVSYCAPNTNIFTQSEMARLIARYSRILSRREDNIGMLNAVLDVLKSAKENCISKEELIKVVREKVECSKKVIKNYTRYIREAKYRRWVIASASSLHRQMFVHRSINGTLSYPSFSTCRDAWYVLPSSPVREKYIYATLAKASAKLEAQGNEIEEKTLFDRSLETYNFNMAQYREPEGDFADYKIHGQAIVSFGVTDGGVPLMLSLDCTFNLRGVIDDMPDVGYDIIAFRPIEDITTKKVPRVRGADTK